MTASGETDGKAAPAGGEKKSGPRKGGVTHPGYHDLEAECAVYATHYFNSAFGGAAGWAWDRLPVALEFGIGRSPCGFRVENAKLVEGRVHAGIVLEMNLGFLVHDFRTYLEQVVPQVVSQALAATIELSKNDRTKVLPTDWATWFKKFTRRDPLVPEEVAARFSTVALDVLDGMQLGACGCDRRDQLHTLNDGQMVRMGQGMLRCDRCGEPIHRLAPEQSPVWLRDEIEFLADARDGLARHLASRKA